MLGYDIILTKAGIDQTSREYIQSKLIIALIVPLGILIPYFVFNAMLNLELPINIFTFSSSLAIIIIFSALYYPIFRIKARASEIDDILPLLITYLGGISTSQASRDQLFDYSGRKEKEFGLGANEMKRVRTLATEWNLGYPDALEIVSDSTPSNAMSDFLGRFSQALESGEKLDEFFAKEQKSALDLYISSYRRSLSSLQLIGEAYQAINISYIFVTLTSLILTMLFGSGDVIQTMLSNIVLLIGVNVPLLLSLKAGTFPDPLTSITYKDRSLEKLNQVTLFIFGIIFPPILVVAILFTVPFWFVLIVFGLVTLPIGILSEHIESLVRRRDENFPVFIRTLGGTAEAMGGTTLASLQSIMTQNLGPLSDNISGIVARLEFGIEDNVAWEEFAREAGSSLIQRFISLYLEAVLIGGSPDQTSKFVSQNAERILEVRKDRDQTIGTIKGTIFPMHVTNVGIMIFMSKIIILLTLIMSAGANSGSTELEMDAAFSSSGTVDEAILMGFFNIIIILLTIFNALAITIPKQGLIRSMLRSMGIMFIVSGITVLFVGQIADAMFASFLQGFSE